MIIKEGGEYVFGSTDLALKCTRIVNFCGKSSGFADFEKTVARGSAVNFDADSTVPALIFGFWVQNEIFIIDLSSALVC